jgi:hypothetical protein
LCLIICYICALLDPKKGVILVDDDHTKEVIKRLNISINFCLIFNLILVPISIFILTTQPLIWQYLITQLDSLGMLNTPIINLPFYYVVAILAEYPLSVISAFIIFLNFFAVLVAAINSMWLLYLRFKHLSN